GFRERETRQLLAARERGEVPALLLLAPVEKETFHAEVVARVDGGERGVAVCDLFDCDELSRCVETQAPVLLGDRDPHQTEIREARDELRWIRAGTVALGRAGDHLLPR